MDREEELFLKRIKELAYQAETRGYATLTDFLNLNELNLFFSHIKELPHIQYKLWGGYENADRCRLCFYQTDDIPLEEFHISIIKISPNNSKFADTLTHRDFLGALVNLGINRGKLGDILIKDNIGYLFVEETISSYIIDSLNKIKHTYVNCSPTYLQVIDITPSYQEVKGTISSARLDAILALALNSSRSSITGLISSGKVFINSRIVTHNSTVLKENDIISVRGHGKYVYCGITHQTKKGRYCATILRYI